MQETRVQSLGRDDPLEEEMATHSSILTWKIPSTEEPGELQSMGSHNLVTKHPQSCLEEKGPNEHRGISHSAFLNSLKITHAPCRKTGKI